MMDPAMMGMMGGGPAAQPAPNLEDVAAEVRRLLREIASADGVVDPEEDAKIAKIDALVADLLANRHKQAQAALGGGPATQFINRAVSGA